MGDVILRAQHINKAFIGVQALSDVSVDIRSGETLCLAGENGSGKSTFVKTVSGIYQPDGGEILIGGESYRHLSPQQAIRLGIQVIYQDLSLFQHMTVAENIALNRIRQEGRRVIAWKEVYRIARAQTERIGVTLDLNTTIMETSMANRQLAAICRALAQDAKILFMDEPTTALTRQEVARLLQVVGELKTAGLAVVFISHKLDEVFQSPTGSPSSATAGRSGTSPAGAGSEEAGVLHDRARCGVPALRSRGGGRRALMEVRGLTKAGNFEDIHFTVRRGDIFGLTGLLGSGRTELALSLFGLNPPDRGEIVFEGRRVTIHSPSAAKQIGIALLPEDRSTQGMFRDRCVRENLSSAMVEEISTRMGVLDRAREAALAENSVKRLRVRTPSVETPIGSLSGGNQQKAIVAKWVNARPNSYSWNRPPAAWFWAPRRRSTS
jgi:simple sugar transport system ATP-binding protein